MPCASSPVRREARAVRCPVLKFGLQVTPRLLAALLLSMLLASHVSAQKNKNRKDTEPPTQVLPPLPEPPDAIAAETAKLSFQVSPLSNKGLLSQQVRDALRALLRDNHGAQIVKLRAFVAGSGDLRRVQTIVAEEFTEKKLPLPVISTIQVGALPLVGAQVVIEAASVEKQAANAVMLRLFPAVSVKDLPTAVEDLRVRSGASEMMRVTCFVGSLEDAAPARSSLAAAFPKAVLNVVQTQRQSLQPFAACEGTTRDPLDGNKLQGSFNVKGLIAGPKIIFTGTKLVFRDDDADILLAFQRLLKAIEPFGATKDDVIWTGEYALTNPVAMKVATLRSEFTGVNAAASSGICLFEGLPSTDATAAIELIAQGH